MSDSTHPPQTCTDEYCPLPFCRIWKEAYEAGYGDGHSAGVADGYGSGYADGAASAGGE